MTGKQAALDVLQETNKKFEYLLANQKSITKSIQTIAQVYSEVNAHVGAYRDAFDEAILEANNHQESGEKIPKLEKLPRTLKNILDWQVEAEIFYCDSVIAITEICQCLEQEIDVEGSKLLKPISDEHSAEESC